MGILDGKQLLVAGFTMDTSIGFAVARQAQEQGATVVVSNFGRALSLTRRVVKRLPVEPAVIELDVTDPDHLDRLPQLLGEHVDRLGASLGRAVEHYNGAVASLESRVLVTARKFTDLQSGPALDAPAQVDHTPRRLQAPELLTDARPEDVLAGDVADRAIRDAAQSPRAEGADGEDGGSVRGRFAG